MMQIYFGMNSDTRERASSEEIWDRKLPQHKLAEKWICQYCCRAAAVKSWVKFLLTICFWASIAKLLCFVIVLNNWFRQGVQNTIIILLQTACLMQSYSQENCFGRFCLNETENSCPGNVLLCINYVLNYGFEFELYFPSLFRPLMNKKSSFWHTTLWICITCH